MLGRPEVSCTIAGRLVVSRAAAAAESAFCRAAAAAVVTESYTRCVRIRSIGTRAESGSSSRGTCVVSSDLAGSSAWLNSTRTEMESTYVAVQGRRDRVSGGRGQIPTLLLESRG